MCIIYYCLIFEAIEVPHTYSMIRNNHQLKSGIDVTVYYMYGNKFHRSWLIDKTTVIR